MFKRPTNKAERLALRQAFIPRDYRPILEHTNDSALYICDANSKFYAIAFWGSSAKPMFHHVYRTEAQRDAKIQEFKRSVEASVNFRSERKAAKQSAPCTLKVGDIVNTSWGYDQTNVDFYVITRIGNRRVWVRQIVQDYEATGFMCGRCWPKMPIEMVGPETMHVTEGNHFSIKGHGASLTTGDTYTSSYA